MVGPLGAIVGISFGASSTSGGGYPPETPVNNWPPAIALIAGSALAAFWLVAAGVFFNWLAAVYEAVTAQQSQGSDRQGIA
jgi:hypothetical protein